MSLPSVTHCVSSDAEQSGPFRYSARAVIPSDPSSRCSVSVLREEVRPSAISRIVSLAIIDAVYRVSCWAWSHVSVEHGEVMPLSTDSNTLSTISGKQVAGWFFASADHACPDTVFSAFVHPMFGMDTLVGFLAQASARFNRSALQMASSCSGNISTLAQTFPVFDSGGRSARQFSYCKSAKGLIGKLLDWSAHMVQLYTSNGCRNGFYCFS